MGAEPPSSTPSISEIIPFRAISPVCKNRYHKFLGFHFRNKNVIRQTLPQPTYIHTYIHKNDYTVDSKMALDLSSKYQ